MPVNGDEVAKLTLEPANGSAVVGTATFTEVTDGIEVELDVSGLPKPGAVYLAHIHEGTC